MQSAQQKTTFNFGLMKHFNPKYKKNNFQFYAVAFVFIILVWIQRYTHEKTMTLYKMSKYLAQKS